MATTLRKKAANAPDLPPPPALPDDPRHRELLGKLWADPDADAPRAVYADWLTEHGDPRGEFIALGLKEAPLVDAWPRDEAALDELQKQLKTLVKNHGKEWVAPIRPYVRAWTWRRGFLRTVTCDTRLFIEGAHALTALSPDLVVTLTALKKLAIVTSGLTSAGALALDESKTLPAALDTLEINFEGWRLPVSTPAAQAVMSRFPKSVP